MNWRCFFRRKQRDVEAARDIAFYLETEIECNQARGLNREEACAAARRKLGNPGLIREEIYRMNGIAFLDNPGRGILDDASAPPHANATT
jgi:hypothetical protein